MIFLCCAVVGALGLITVNERTSAMTFGTSSDKIKISTDDVGAEISEIFDSIFSFLPSRE